MEMTSANVKGGEKVYISTYGCQMNEHDTERMYSLLELNKYLQATSPEEADIIIINSCSVREKPVHKVLSEIGTYKEIKQAKPHLKIGVGGCVGQQEGKKLLSGNRMIDFVFGTDTIDQLPQILSEVRNEKKRDAWTKMGHREEYSIETMVRQTKANAFVTITKGCDNFCSFCVVPFTRGRERSRLMGELISDIKGLVARGVKEVTLLGQNVNSYKSPDGAGGLSELLTNICTQTDIERLRFTTSHPKDFDDRLIEVLVKYIDKLGHFVHLPVQSGSSRVLEAMNRGYTREEYIEKVMKIKKAIPDVNLSTDIIVGFPGETEEDFQQTLSMLAEVQYENVYAFIYSPRPFTKALKFTEQVSEDVKSDRLQRILKHQDSLIEKIVSKYEGKVFPVLVEGPSRGNKDLLIARTTHNKVVHFAADPSVIGTTIPVRIAKAMPFVLQGELLS